LLKSFYEIVTYIWNQRNQKAGACCLLSPATIATTATTATTTTTTTTGSQHHHSQCDGSARVTRHQEALPHSGAAKRSVLEIDFITVILLCWRKTHP
jgi:hypothetical protein